MAEADPLLDEDLEDADRRTVADIENPIAQSGNGPEPADLDEIEPPPVAPPEAPGALPGAAETQMGAPSPATDIIARENEAEALAQRQGDVNTQKATIAANTAQAQADAAREADEDARLERADYLQRRQDAEKALDERTKKYEQTHLTDPRARTPLKSKLSVVFGGLGGAFRSAGGGDSKNNMLAALQKQWDDDVDLQKANIAALRDSAVQARTRLHDIDEGRAAMRRDADARLLSKYNLALKQGEAQLRSQGIPQAGIDADQRIASLRAGRAAALERARKDDDAHAIAQARIAALKAKAERDARKAKGGGAGGGGGGGGGGAAIAQYLIDNPGDIPGAMKMRARLGVGSKEFNQIVNHTKGTEGQNKNAHQAKVGMDAVDAISKSGYQPSKDDIQKWLNNSRLVHLADSGGIAGGLATLGQTAGALPQSEVEGLSPQAQEYFGNVRRYMETIGRAQSGAAISPSEWTNFFNQYGPNSKGGLDAARQYLREQFKLSGVAGRQVAAGEPEKAAAAKPEAAKPAAAGFVVGQVRKLRNGTTVKITSADGDYQVVSGGR
jgi:hypothetical protein